MKLEIYCAMCGKEQRLDVDARNGVIQAGRAIEASGWVTEQNGKNFDIYCSKRCAS